MKGARAIDSFDGVADRRWIFFLTAGFAALALLLLFAALAGGWFGPAAWGAGSGEFCEEFRDGLIKQPVNTWSNVGFLGTGLYVAWTLGTARHEKQNNPLTRTIFFPTLYACIVVYLGPGSMAMHASGAHLGGFFDMISMYLIASFLVAYGLQRRYQLKALPFAALFAAALTSCIWAHWQPYHVGFDFFGVTAFAVYLTVGVLLELSNVRAKGASHQSRWVYLSLGALLFGVAVWLPSKTGAPLCAPRSLFQGHAVWHLANAAALYFLFRFYVSEHREGSAFRA